MPVRLIRSRIHYEDLQRQPYTLVYPDGHHRNETPVRFADPSISLHFSRAAGAWDVASRVGLSIPVGRTEPNPFELGRLGLPHEHFQFGSGTWDPVLALGAGRQLGKTSLTLVTLAHLTLYENAHGFQAGNRYSLNTTLAGPLVSSWGGSVWFDLTREEAEHWNGKLEEEGNLGRTDAMISLGLSRPIASAGGIAFSVGIPVYSQVHGEQGVQPLVFTLSWSHEPMQRTASAP